MNASCKSFAAIDAARGDTSLTYFELAPGAMHSFIEEKVDVAIMEVGLVAGWTR
jgi:dihydrofolate synthase/folylpolyglutamate synthase